VTKIDQLVIIIRIIWILSLIYTKKQLCVYVIRV
jgi:hypothetical protein